MVQQFTIYPKTNNIENFQTRGQKHLWIIYIRNIMMISW